MLGKCLPNRFLTKKTMVNSWNSEGTFKKMGAGLQTRERADPPLWENLAILSLGRVPFKAFPCQMLADSQFWRK